MNRESMITTATYVVGRYKFASLLPQIGTSADKPTWIAGVDGSWLKGGFDSLEDAMRAVLAEPIYGAAGGFGCSHCGGTGLEPDGETGSYVPGRDPAALSPARGEETR